MKKNPTPSNAFARSRKMMVARYSAKGARHGSTLSVTIPIRRYQMCTTVSTASHGHWTIVVPPNDNGCGGNGKKARMGTGSPGGLGLKLNGGDRRILK
jgi:hypothetical protein